MSSGTPHWTGRLSLRPEVVASDGRCRRAADEPAQGRVPDRRCALPRGRLLRRHHPAHSQPRRVLRPGRPSARRTGSRSPSSTSTRGWAAARATRSSGCTTWPLDPTEFFATELGTARARRGPGRAAWTSTSPVPSAVALTADYFRPGKTNEVFGPATTLVRAVPLGARRWRHGPLAAYVAQRPQQGTLFSRRSPTPAARYSSCSTS